MISLIFLQGCHSFCQWNCIESFWVLSNALKCFSNLLKLLKFKILSKNMAIKKLITRSWILLNLNGKQNLTLI